jgi:hypothetical protein
LPWQPKPSLTAITCLRRVPSPLAPTALTLEYMAEGPSPGAAESNVTHLRAIPAGDDMVDRAEERVTEVFASVVSARTRGDISLVQGPTPQRLAPHAMTMLASVADPDSPDDDSAMGRFVLLHDPAGQPAWNGTWRIVTFLSAQMDSEAAHDPLLPEVAQTWLHEGAALAGVTIEELSGTVTMSQSYPFGALAEKQPDADVEIRCSWTPQPDVDGLIDARSHMRAWLHVVSTAAGLPPEIEGVATLPTR